MNAEERRGIEDERMNALEQDNAGEDQEGDDSDFSEEEEEPQKKRRRGTRNRNPGNSKNKNKRNVQEKKRSQRKFLLNYYYQMKIFEKHILLQIQKNLKYRVNIFALSQVCRQYTEIL